MKRNASIDLRGGRVFVSPSSKTESGFHIGHGPISVLADGDIAGIGEALMAAFEASRSGVPDPQRGAQIGVELYAAAGVKDHREFAKGAKSITATLDAGQVTLIPWKNEGVRASFVPIKGKDRVVAADSPDLGATVLAALSDAE